MIPRLPGSATSARPSLAWVAALVALAIAGVAAYYAGTAAEARERLRFERALESTRSTIETRLTAYIAMLRAGTGLFSAHPALDRDDFRAYVDRLDLARHYPGIQGIGFSLRLAPREVPSLALALRGRGFTGFQVWPDTPRPEYHAIIYLEPLDRRNRAALGYDMFSEPVRRAAMERARDTGQPAASGMVTLVQEIDERKQPGFLIYVPVYEGGASPATETERRARLRGFVYSPFRTYDLLRGILGPRTMPVAARFSLFDGEAADAARLLYRSDDEAAAAPADHLTATTRIDVAGRPWTLVFSAPAEALGGRVVATSLAVAGLAISGLLFLMIRSQIQGRLTAERLAHERLEAERRSRQLAEETEARRQEALALFELGHLLSETLEPEAVGRRVVDHVRRLLRGEMAVLYRADRVSGDLHLLAGTGSQVAQRLPRGTATVGAAIAERQPVTTSDVLHDPRIALEPDSRARIERSGHRAVLAVPLLLKDRAFGALAVGDRAGRVFDADEIRLLQTFAQTAVLALENAQLYAEERAARREAELGSRAKDEFLAILSHELRTPLNAMFGWIRLLSGGQLDPERHAQALTVIERNARLQAHLIDDLLDVSRIIAGKLQIDRRPLDLAPLIEESIELIRRDADARRLEIALTMEPGAGLVTGDAVRLQQIVVNLVGNAVKFTPDKGRIEVDLRRVGNTARLTVTDSGQGIDRDLLPGIFDPFRQAESPTKRGQAGLGLGLAIVRSLVELHGGTVTAASEGSGRGATFTVTLPVAAVRPGPGLPDVLPGGGGGGEATLRGRRVLVVDDNADSRELIRVVLENAGAEVVAAESVAEARACVSRTAVDVVVTDLGMPGEDGYDLLRTLRRLEADKGAPAMPVVALTAFASLQDRDRVLAAGFHAHITKPVDPDRLIEVLAAVTVPAA